MKRLITTAMLAALAVAGFMRVARAQDQDPPLEPRVLAYDKGPAKIDVSKYPAPLQKSYKLFLAKCGHCHTPARAINCDFVLDDEWERYVKRMMRKAGSYITPDEGKAIYEFVVYDSKTRKKDLYDKKLKEAGKPGSDR